MKIDKSFDITVSHKFPNGDIVSLRFGTSKQVENILDDAGTDVIKDLEQDLSRQVMLSTYKDVQRAMKRETVIKMIIDSIPRAIKSEAAELKALKKLEALDAD